MKYRSYVLDVSELADGLEPLQPLSRMDEERRVRKTKRSEI